jgi:hypothetical protein
MSDSKQIPQAGVSRGGSMPAGLEHPPRRYPPDPQHLDVQQTYDPRVSVQLERTKRDLASGKPGAAAREDLDNPKAGPRPEQRVEGIPPRETVVTFSTQFASYFAGESAAFTPDEAARLGELGVTDGGGGAATAPPTNVDVPYVSQTGDTLNCTMGNWDGAPTAYAYQWQIDGADIGTDAATYVVTAADVGHTATCVVTASNDLGSTAAPPSNGVVVAAAP